MSIRSLTVSAALAAAVVLPLTGGVVLAQADQAPQVSNAKYQVTGIVNANNVFVRSGPGDSFYATMKLNKGDRITVVGQKFGWLKVTPPEGSYSYVAKAYVERTADGTVGHVTKPELMVRAGSSENALKYAVQTKLNKGDEVQIIGQEDEYFKIKPPQGAYLYVSKQYVTPAQAVDPAAAKTAASDAPAVTQTPDHMSSAPAAESDEQASNDAPATKPAGPTVVERFKQIDAKFLAASEQPLTSQPIDELLKEYQSLAASGNLSDAVKAAIDSRVATLKLRADALKELEKAKAEWAADQKKAQANEAERQEIMQRLKSNEIKYFTAVGALRTSSLRDGNEALFRLTDPQSGHTVVYLRDKDQKLAEATLGSLLGVDGTLTHGRAGITILVPSKIESLDPDEIGRKVMAQMMPESMLSRISAAATQPAASDK